MCTERENPSHCTHFTVTLYSCYLISQLCNGYPSRERFHSDTLPRIRGISLLKYLHVSLTAIVKEEEPEKFSIGDRRPTLNIHLSRLRNARLRQQTFTCVFALNSVRETFHKEPGSNQLAWSTGPLRKKSCSAVLFAVRPLQRIAQRDSRS